MSGAPAGGSAATTKATPNTSANDSSQPLQGGTNDKKTIGAQLGEDDEFEDFPVQDWPKEEEVGGSSAGAGTAAGTTHLWEESWDDDDTSDEFSMQLREELKKMKK